MEPNYNLSSTIYKDYTIQDLMIATQDGNLELVKIIFANLEETYKGRIVELINKFELLFIALEVKNFEMTQFLLQKGADTYIFDEFENSPLMVAVSTEQLNLVQLLVEYDAEVNTVNQNNRSALQVACTKGNFEIINFLLSRGANVHKNINKYIILNDNSDENNNKKISDLLSNHLNAENNTQQPSGDLDE